MLNTEASLLVSLNTEADGADFFWFIPPEGGPFSAPAWRVDGLTLDTPLWQVWALVSLPYSLKAENQAQGPPDRCP